MRQRHSVIFTILTGRDPGHFFEKFKEIGIAGEAEKFLYLGDGPALCQHRLGEVSPLHGDIMPDGGMGMFLEQAPEIVLVQVEFCSNAFQGQWLCQMPVDKGHAGSGYPVYLAERKNPHRQKGRAEDAAANSDPTDCRAR